MLEYIVRPFQAPDSHGKIVIPSTPTASTDTAVLTWGGESDLPDVQYFETGFTTKKGRQDFDEKARDSNTVRIMGQSPDDDSPSYIDVDRGDKLYFDWYTGQRVQVETPGLSNYVNSYGIQDLAELGLANIATDPAKGKATMKLKNTGS